MEPLSTSIPESIAAFSVSGAARAPLATFAEDFSKRKGLENLLVKVMPT